MKTETGTTNVTVPYLRVVVRTNRGQENNVKVTDFIKAREGEM